MVSRQKPGPEEQIRLADHLGYEIESMTTAGAIKHNQAWIGGTGVRQVEARMGDACPCGCVVSNGSSFMLTCRSSPVWRWHWTWLG